MIKKSLSQQVAFSLLEVLVSLSIFSVGALAAASAFSTQLSFNSQSETRSGAIMAAQQVLDEIRISDPASLPSSGTSAAQNITIGNKLYVVTVTYCSPSTYCTSTNIRALKAIVKHNNSTVYTVDTIYAQLR